MSKRLPPEILKEHQQAQMSAWYQKNKEQAREKSRAYYHAHREQARVSRAAYASKPEIRMQLLAQQASHRAKRGGFQYEPELRGILKAAPPTNCLCCGVVLDYTARPEEKTGPRELSPSLDRVDNTLGYTVENTRVICWHCNKRKDESTLKDLYSLVAYVQNNLPRPLWDGVVY